MKKAFAKWELLMFLAMVALLAAILFPALMERPEPGGPSSCHLKLRAIGQSFQMYIHDYDEKYPPARAGNTGRGWADALAPYDKNISNKRGTSNYDCPSNTGGVTDGSSGVQHTDYFMNSRLPGVSQSRLVATSRTILNGEGEADMTPASAVYAIPSHASIGPGRARQIQNRHVEGSNFGFTDGHVKWLKPGKVSDARSPKDGILTFAPR